MADVNHFRLTQFADFLIVYLAIVIQTERLIYLYAAAILYVATFLYIRDIGKRCFALICEFCVVNVITLFVRC